MTRALSVAPLDLQPQHALAVLECQSAWTETDRGRRVTNPTMNMARALLAPAGKFPHKITKLSREISSDMDTVRRIMTRAPSLFRRLQKALLAYKQTHEWIYADDREISLDTVCQVLAVDPEVFQEAFLDALPDNERRMAMGLLPWKCPLCLQMKR